MTSKANYFMVKKAPRKKKEKLCIYWIYKIYDEVSKTIIVVYALLEKINKLKYYLEF